MDNIKVTITMEKITIESDTSIEIVLPDSQKEQ